MRTLLSRPLLLLALVAGLRTQGIAQAPEPLLSVHLVTTEIGPGVKLCEELRTGLKIAYEPDALLTLADVDSVRLAREGETGPFTVELVLSIAGRTRLYQMSTENVGRRVAIIVDNVAHAVPLIREPLDLDRLPVGFYPEESYARQLAAQLAAALEGK